MLNAIECPALTRRFDAVTAVDNTLTLSVADSGMFGLRGPNGAGKTTTIKMLIALLGHATVAGHDVLRDARAIRRSIGYVPRGSRRDRFAALPAPGAVDRPARRDRVGAEGSRPVMRPAATPADGFIARGDIHPCLGLLPRRQTGARLLSRRQPGAGLLSRRNLRFTGTTGTTERCPPRPSTRCTRCTGVVGTAARNVR